MEGPEWPDHPTAIGIAPREGVETRRGATSRLPYEPLVRCNIHFGGLGEDVGGRALVLNKSHTKDNTSTTEKSFEIVRSPVQMSVNSGPNRRTARVADSFVPQLCKIKEIVSIH